MVGLYHFEWSWTTPNSNFNVTQLFDAEYLRNGTTDRHSYNEILIWDLHTPDWKEGVISSDLEWLSEIFSGMKHIVRSLCDSWASCYEMRDIDIGMLSVCSRQGVANRVAGGRRPPSRKLWHIVGSKRRCWLLEKTTKCLWQGASTLRQRQQNSAFNCTHSLTAALDQLRVVATGSCHCLLCALSTFQNHITPTRPKR